MFNYAGIGTRAPTRQQGELCTKVGQLMATYGWVLHTGAAKGADQLFAEGALAGNGKVVLHLPWKKFEEEWVGDFLARAKWSVELRVVERSDHEAHELVRKLHGSPGSLGKAFPLMSRNVRIVKPSIPCRFVIAARSPYGEETGRGGTEFGCSLAIDLNIALLSIRESMTGRETEELRRNIAQIVQRTTGVTR